MAGAKKRARGRRRIVTAEREPNGRAQRSRPQAAEDARLVAIQARQRVFGLTAEQARQEEAESVLGRLSQSGELHPHPPMARALYVAGKRFEEVKRDYLWAIEAKRELAGGDIDRGPGGHDNETGDDEEFVRVVNRKIGEWQDMRRDLLEADPLAMMACECIIMEDKYAPSLIGALRCGLNAIAREMQRQGKAA